MAGDAVAISISLPVTPPASVAIETKLPSLKAIAPAIEAVARMPTEMVETRTNPTRRVSDMSREEARSAETKKTSCCLTTNAGIKSNSNRKYRFFNASRVDIRKIEILITSLFIRIEKYNIDVFKKNVI
ncbi:hypothetical protein [Pelagibacterium mangrovi]|uniref:hypothetical protein n=1 Tax=Pelagibacterium mangrovi TaxID=3119828 RepID=UPI002FC9F510